MNNGDFITFADANAGLKFDPTPNSFGSGSFDVQASLSNSDAGLGGAVVTATVTVNSINDAPVVPDQPDIAAIEQTAVTLYPSITISDVDLDAFNGGLGDYAGATFAIGQATPSAGRLLQLRHDGRAVHGQRQRQRPGSGRTGLRHLRPVRRRGRDQLHQPRDGSDDGPGQRRAPAPPIYQPVGQSAGHGHPDLRDRRRLHRRRPGHS